MVCLKIKGQGSGINAFVRLQIFYKTSNYVGIGLHFGKFLILVSRDIVYVININCSKIKVNSCQEILRVYVRINGKNIVGWVEAKFKSYFYTVSSGFKLKFK